MNKLTFIILISFISLSIISCSEEKEEFSDNATTTTTGTTTTSDNTSTSDNSTTTTTLSAPSGFTATSAAGLVTLDWTAVSGASSYTMFWGTASGITSSNTAITSITTDNYTHTGRDNGTTYYYKVSAVNSAGTGTLSSEVNASTPLPAPANFTATSGNAKNTLDWDNVTGATSYTVYWDNATGVSSSSTAITSVSTDNYTHSSLTNGSTYYYKVAAVAASGTGTLSSEVNATPVNPLMGGAIQGTVLSLSTVVTTFAGTAGSTGNIDDTGTSALFHYPTGITTDGTYLYVTNAEEHTIRKIVISSGVVTTLAGTAGSPGTTDGTGTSAKLTTPQDITTDGTNLYVTSYFKHTIRKIVISSGVVTTYAGTVGTSGSTDASGTSALFKNPLGITTDGTNLYVSDLGNFTIRKIVISTGAVTTLAGTVGTSGSTDTTGTSAKFNNARMLTTDGTNLFVAGDDHTIRKIVISSGVVTTLAGTDSPPGSTDATGTSAKFNNPTGITTDGTNLYVTGFSNNRIRKIVISSGVVTTLAGSGSPGSVDATGTSAKFWNPTGITTDGTNLYVTDFSSHTIRKIE